MAAVTFLIPDHAPHVPGASLSSPVLVGPHDDAVCSQCGKPVVGADCLWRCHFPLLADFWVEYAHPECVGGEGAKTVPESNKVTTRAAET